jgi:hypothetical protein
MDVSFDIRYLSFNYIGSIKTKIPGMLSIGIIM